MQQKYLHLDVARACNDYSSHEDRANELAAACILHAVLRIADKRPRRKVTPHMVHHILCTKKGIGGGH